MRCNPTRSRLTSTSAILLLSLSSSALAAELSPEAESLLADVERVVSAEQGSGWFLDQQSQDSIRGTVLQSVCRAPEAARTAALAELERRHAARGDARAVFEREGRELTSRVEEALFVERQLEALRKANESAATACPFWVTVQSRFRGRQTDRDRFTLNLESGGNAQLRETESTWTLGGGGLLRVLFGYGFAGKATLLGGIEFGGGAMIKPNVDPTEFVINYFPALPVVLRLHDVSWHYDFEAAPVALFQADNGDFSYGVRGAFGLGLAALRTRGLIPWGGGALAYEYYLPSGGRAAQHFIRGGLRVGFVWDP